MPPTVRRPWPKAPRSRDDIAEDFARDGAEVLRGLAVPYFSLAHAVIPAKPAATRALAAADPPSSLRIGLYLILTFNFAVIQEKKVPWRFVDVRHKTSCEKEWLVCRENNQW